MSSKWEVFINQFITKEAYKNVIDGLGVTLTVAVLGLILGIAIGTLLAITKVVPQYKWGAKIASKITSCYVALFRGTPMVVQLLVGYFVLLPALNIQTSNLNVAIAVFGLNSGAYICEIMRSGIQSVDKGQMEAGRAVGLSFTTTMVKIVIPQAIKNILPTMGNEFIVLIKETSVLSFIAVVDLTKAFVNIGNANYEFIVPYLMLAAVYLVLVLIITALIRLMERRLNRSDRRS